MKKTLSAILILTVMVLGGCAHQPPPVQPPPPEPPRVVAPPLPAPRQAPAPAPRERMKTELLLMGTLPPSSSESLEQVVNKKKAIYQALKGLGGKNSILIVYDASGSMREKIGETKTKKFEAAYEGLTRIGTLFGPDDHVWLFVFGSKKPFGLSSEGILYRKDYVRAMEAAEDVGLIYDSSEKGFRQNDFQAAIQFLGSEKAYIGDTPIGYAVVKAHQVLKGVQNAKVILISDGVETGPMLAQVVSKDSAWELRLRKRYTNYDELTMSALDAVKGLVKDHIHFSPIIYGLGSSPGGGKEAQGLKDFYQKLASESGGVSLEAVTPLEVLNAFMDAEMMSLTYGLYALEGGSGAQFVAQGRVGVPLIAEVGRYRLRVNTERPLEQEIELKPQAKNGFVFNIDQGGKLKIVPVEPNP